MHFPGVLVKFNFDNNNFVGIETEYVEDYSFEDLPYFYNDTFEEGIEEPISITKYLDSWLSHNEYGCLVNGKLIQGK